MTVVVLAFLPSSRSFRQRWVLERRKGCPQLGLAVLDSPKPGEASLCWLTDQHIWIVRVRGDRGVIVYLPQVDENMMLDSSLLALRRNF